MVDTATRIQLIARLKAEVALLSKQVEQLTQENLKMAAQLTFVRGGDIPETIERTRLQLVAKLQKMESLIIKWREVKMARSKNELGQELDKILIPGTTDDGWRPLTNEELAMLRWCVKQLEAII